MDDTRSMNTYEAVELIEGGCDHEDFVAAFQALIDTGAVWRLQGWYGRQAAALIEAGECELP